MRIRRVAVAAAAVFTATATTAVAAGVIPTYQEYRASAFQDEDGKYIVNGDEPIDNTGELHEYYDQMVGNTKGKTTEGGLIVNTVNGKDDVWTATQVKNLTYCVSTKFGKDYSAVVSAMAAGSGQWESASSAINFSYVPAQDSACTVRNANVTFSVEPTKTTQYIARSFFPSTSKSGRNILVNASSLQNSGSWTPSNILAHELGHILGLRHEHTRPEAGTCFEDNNWRPLTAYDSSSIMHYPQCNGMSANLSMTDTDRAGIRSLYGA